MSPELLEINVTIDIEELEVVIDNNLPQMNVTLDSAETNVTIDDTPDVIVIASGGIGPEGPVGPMGPEGLQGPPGPVGPEGPVGEQTTFIFNQLAAATQWNITHSLNRYPSVTVIDSGGSELIPDIQYNGPDILILYFSNPTSGTAYLN